ncbi:MAG: GNAT family N-acetyltransferase [Bacteroidetes bacterium]|nr:GNAT family N-acetyltransferase [Bacteroidota bacterium]
MFLEILPATKDHAALLCKIGAQFFYDAYKDVKSETDLQEYIADAFLLVKVEAEFDNPMLFFAIGYVNKIPVAYIKLRSDRTHPNLEGIANLEIERIYVDRQYWRYKFGGAMMNYAIEYARQNKFDCLWLGVWQENNRAISFYKNAGFEIFGTKKFYVGSEENNDFVMRLMLS